MKKPYAQPVAGRRIVGLVLATLLVFSFIATSLVYMESLSRFSREWSCRLSLRSSCSETGHLEVDKSVASGSGSGSCASGSSQSQYTFCPECGPGDRLCQEYGYNALRRSRAFEGSGYDLRRIIAKAEAGLPIRIASLGGSNTACRGVDRKDCWPQRFFDAWNATWPHPENALFNGAVPATGSSYFAFCYMHHIPQDVDLVILEYAVNDSRYWNPQGAKYAEFLFRALLNLPSRPALMWLAVHSPHWATYLTAQENHQPLVQYYDMPMVSLKNMLYHYTNSHMDQLLPKYWIPDENHLNAAGHNLAAELLMSFVQSQTCAMKTLPQSLLQNTTYDIGVIPPFGFFSTYETADQWQEPTPACQTLNSAESEMKIISASGWERWSWNDEKHYLVADKPGSTVTFDIDVSAGSVFVEVFKSPKYDLGDVFCFIDTNRTNGAVIPGWHDKQYNIAMTMRVSENVTPGNHNLTCELRDSSHNPDNPNGRHFRIIAIASI